MTRTGRRHLGLPAAFGLAVVAAGVVADGPWRPAAADPNCRCRLFGEYFELGTVKCIRGHLARCEMNLNNTSWKTIADVCPEARLAPATVAAAGRPKPSLPKL